jgi:hypothetical protein
MKLDIDTSNLDAAMASTTTLRDQWSEIAALAREHKHAAVLTTQVAKLELAAGDALVLTTPSPLSVEQHARVTEYVCASLGRVVPVLILDGGVTMAQLSVVASDGRTA